MIYLKKCPGCYSEKFEFLIETPSMMKKSQKRYRFSQCSQCDLIFLNPRLGPNQLASFYDQNYLPFRSEKAWGKYSKIVASGQRSIDRKRLKICTKNFKIIEKTKVLDIGCGRPTFLKYLQKKTRAQTTGIDFSNQAWGDFNQAL